ncbi:MAG: hypothetical protein VW498_02235 [Candidatus Thalassarchaeaceae archaeon]
MSLKMWIISISSAVLIAAALISSVFGRNLDNAIPGAVVPINFVCKNKDTVENILKGNQIEAMAIVSWSVRSGECVIFPEDNMQAVVLKKMVASGSGLNHRGKPALYQVWSIVTADDVTQQYYIGLMANESFSAKT